MHPLCTGRYDNSTAQILLGALARRWEDPRSRGLDEQMHFLLVLKLHRVEMESQRAFGRRYKAATEKCTNGIGNQGNNTSGVRRCLAVDIHRRRTILVAKWILNRRDGLHCEQNAGLDRPSRRVHVRFV